MKKYITLFFAVLLLAGCNIQGQTAKEPPTVKIEADGKSYDTVLGTFCWNGKCEDHAGPVELMKDKVTLQVKAGEKLQLKQSTTNLPTTSFLTELNSIEQGKDLPLTEDGEFTAPAQAGTYYYGYTASWRDEKKDVSIGDAQYAFALKVLP